MLSFLEAQVVLLPHEIGGRPLPVAPRPLCAAADARYALPWAVRRELGGMSPERGQREESLR